MSDSDLGAERFVVRAPVAPMVPGLLVLLVAVSLLADAKLFARGALGPFAVSALGTLLAAWWLRRSVTSGRTTLRIFERGACIAPAWRIATGPLGTIAWRDVKAVASRRAEPDGKHRELTRGGAADEAQQTGVALLHRDGAMMRIPGALLRSDPAATRELLERAFEAASAREREG